MTIIPATLIPPCHVTYTVLLKTLHTLFEVALPIVNVYKLESVYYSVCHVINICISRNILQ